MKVLISAYLCQPDYSSEAEIGWQWVNSLSKYNDIVVITKKPNFIEKIDRDISGKIRFEYYDLPKIFNFMKKGDIKHFIYYNLWQIGAYLRAKKLTKKEKFDLIHHLVYVNTWQPTYMPFLGLPFIFGPIGENSKVPIGIIKYYGIGVIFREAIGRLIKKVGRDINPIMRLIYRKADKIIAINNDVKNIISRKFWHKTLVCSAIGISLPNISLDNVSCCRSTFCVLYCGRFVYIKCPDIALLGFLKFAHKYSDVELIMVGGGKMGRDLRSILKRYDGSQKVKLMGWVERKKVLEFMKECDVFIFPSFEGGGMVVLEAMSYGKPVICLNYGGAKELITDECGIKISVSNRMQMINEISESLDKLYNNNELRQKLGIAARKRVEEYYTWDKKAEWMNRIYLDAVKKC